MTASHVAPYTPFKDCDSCGQWVVELHTADSISGEGSFCNDCLNCDAEDDFRTFLEAKAEAVRLAHEQEVAHIVIRDWDAMHPSYYVLVDPEPWPVPGWYEEVDRAEFTPRVDPRVLEHDDPDRAREDRLEAAALADYYESTEG